jgi:hypothetical protein
LCKAFGPPSLIRQPTRLRIRWEDDNTLLLEFDAGTQARRLHFTPAPAAARSLQGQSQAKWFRQPQNRGIFGRGGRAAGGSLEVVTTNLRAGYLRPNGVPYSERTVVKEFFDSFTLPDDGTWLIVTTVVNDPEYLTQEFVLSSQFKKETDVSKWSPRPCEIAPPPVTRRASARMKRLVLGVLVLTLGAIGPLRAQWLKLPTAGIPRTASGAPDLAAPAPRTPEASPICRGNGSPPPRTVCRAGKGSSPAASSCRCRAKAATWARASRAGCRTSPGPRRR